MTIAKITAKSLADNAVTSDKLAAGAVTINDISDGEITMAKLSQVDLNIAPEILEIQVDSPSAGQNIPWLWTWLQSTLPYARRTITNSPEISVPLYKQGTYVVNNYAAYDLHDNMTQTHTLFFKWIDGAGTDNLVSWAVDNPGNPISDTHPDINGGNATDVQRINISVPATVTPPTLTAPNVSYTVTNNGAGAYTFSSAASGDNPNIGPWYRGGTYTLNISATGHPIYLTTDNGTNYSSGTYFGEYTTGVNGSRTDSGTLTITVPNDAPDTLYYQCGNHSAMRGAITIKNLAVEVNNNGNYIIYAQHTQEGMKTPVEIRPIPSLVNQMCLVYDANVGKFVPQDLATYVENTPSFENKIREVAGTAELVVEDGSAVIAKVNVYDDSTYLPLVGNNPGDQAFATDTDILYIWDGSAWQQAGAANTDDLAEGTTNLFYTDARVGTYLSAQGYDTATNIVASITDSAPTTLDTLNELAAALGDDPNFATTVTNSIADKLPLSGGTLTGKLDVSTTVTMGGGDNLNNYAFRVSDTDHSMNFDANEIILDSTVNNLTFHIQNQSTGGSIVIGGSATDDWMTISSAETQVNTGRFTNRLQIPSGSAANRPAFGDAGAVYFNTTNSSLDVSNGSDWVSVTFSNYRGLLENVDLDTPSGAYSLRKLTRNYGGACVQVTDGTTNKDIYFDDEGLVDVTELEAFAASVSSNRLGVRIWYDQSGNGKHAVQNTSTNRPYIVNNYSVVRAPNGLPAVKFDGDSGQDYLNISNQIHGGANSHLHVVFCVDQDKEHYLYGAGYDSSEGGLYYLDNAAGRMSIHNGSTSYNLAGDITWPTAPVAYEWQYNTSQYNLYLGNTNNSGSSGITFPTQYTRDHQIGWAIPRNKGTAYFSGYMQELVYWGTSQNLGNMQSTMNDANDFWKLSFVPSKASAATSVFNSSTNETIHTISDSTKVENVLTASKTLTELLLVGGGGGGGAGHTGSSLGGGGGGAGGLIYQTNSGQNSGTYTINIGAGGAGFNGPSANGSGSNDGFPGDTGSNGGNTTGFGFTAIGGGGGGTRNAHENGKDGGSGGGSCGIPPSTGGSGTAGQGNDGGDNVSSEWGACGGGGAGAAGGNATGGSGDYDETPGGNGLQYDISGSNTYYAGGGGGGGQNIAGSTSGAAGGLGGGGRGGNHPNESTGVAGTDGLGGGGGGAPAYNGNNTGDSNGGAGGDGIVIFKVSLN